MTQAGDFRTGRHVVYDLHAHIVLTPKYRRKVMTDRVHKMIESMTREVCESNDATLEEFNTDNDHAHLLVSYPPKVSLSKLIGSIKSNTSKVLREQRYEEVERAIHGDHFWSPSYFVASAGGVPLEKIKRYVQDQGREPKGRGNPNWRHSSPPSRTEVPDAPR